MGSTTYKCICIPMYNCERIAEVQFRSLVVINRTLESKEMKNIVAIFEKDIA